MQNNTKWSLLGVVLVVAVIAVLVSRKMMEHDGASLTQAESTPAPYPRREHTDPTGRKSARQNNQRVGQNDHWVLPVKLQPRLSASERAALMQNPGDTLSRAFPNDDNALNLLVAWSGNDPDAAMHWVDTHENSLGYRMNILLAAVAAGHLIHAGPDAMQEFIATHDKDPRMLPKNHGLLTRSVYQMLGRADTIEPALEMLQKSQDSELAGALVAGVDGSNRKMAVIDFLEAKKLTPNLDYWHLQSDAAENPESWADWAFRRKSDLLPQLIQSWNRKDPQAAKAWIHSEMLKDDPRLAELKVLIE